jgi:formylglycine-generating enzyme required for sulfatase activity
MGNNPSKYRGPRRPVEEIDYQEAEDFCKKLTERSGDKYFLPTKDQWTFIRGDAELNDQYAWMGKDYQVATSPAGENRKPNKFGLYDVLGNVWVWCADAKVRGHAFDSIGGGLRGRITKDDEQSDAKKAGDLGFRCLMVSNAVARVSSH